MQRNMEVITTGRRGYTMELEEYKYTWRVTVRNYRTIVFRTIANTREQAFGLGEKYLVSIGVSL